MKPYRIAAAAALAAVLPIAGLSAAEGPTLISYDHGALDTLEALELTDRVVAFPKQSLPDYLAHLATDDIPDAGSLKAPDLNVIRDLQPDLVLLTGRQEESREVVEALSDVRDVTLGEGGFRDALTDKVNGLASLYGKQDEAGQELDALWFYVEDGRKAASGNGPVVVVTHNLGNFSLRDEPVVSQLLGMAQPALPEGVESVTRGTRVFTPMTPETLSTMAPKHLFVVDRSAAIGDEPLDVDQLRADLSRAGGEEIRVTVLSPGLWYLSGAGLKSTRLQVQEIIDAL